MVLSSNVLELPQDLIEILEPQKIISIFVLPIYVKDQFFGFIGFDDCEKHRIWIKSEIELLKTVTNIISTLFERKQAEAKLTHGRERIKILNKIIRHDLSNDFAVIKSAMNIFKRTADPKVLKEIDKRVMTSLKTIEHYRQYESFIDSNVGLYEIELNEIINKVIAEFPEIKFTLTGNCKIYADEALDSVFKNLIVNSLKHGRSKEIDIKISSERNECKIQFKDNGVGIPDKIKDKIFNEGFFFGDTGNTGIGLHIVKNTIERYGGHITVEDNKPKGAVFEINMRSALKN